MVQEFDIQLLSIMRAIHAAPRFFMQSKSG